MLRGARMPGRDPRRRRDATRRTIAHTPKVAVDVVDAPEAPQAPGSPSDRWSSIRVAAVVDDLVAVRVQCRAEKLFSSTSLILTTAPNSQSGHPVYPLSLIHI